jgi:hypothetical protein
MPQRIADLVDVALPYRRDLPRHAQVVSMVFERFGAHGLGEKQRRRRERQGSETPVQDNVCFGFARVRVDSRDFFGHFPPTTGIVYSLLLGHFVDDTVCGNLVAIIFLTRSYHSGGLMDSWSSLGRKPSFSTAICALYW